MMGAGLLGSSAAGAGRAKPRPRPIPGGTELPDLGLFHFYFPGKGNEVSTITDFRGEVGVAEIEGTGTGTDTPADPSTGLVFEADVRFMKGKFRATDGQVHQGAFGFI